MSRFLPDRRALLLLAAFFALFLALFVQFPLRGELPGNADTQLAIALSNQILEKLGFFFSGVTHTFTVLYPAPDVLAYGENCYGLALLYLFFQALAGGEINGYYLFLSTIFALNAYSVTSLTEVFGVARRFAILAGIAFSLAGFTLGNVDDPNMVFVFFPVMALTFLFRGLEKRDAGWLVFASFMSGAQIWFGFYLFAYQLLLLILFASFNAKALRGLFTPRSFGLCALAFAVPVFPLFVLYVLNYEYAQIVSPYEVFADCSLSWDNFLHRLPNNLLYPDPETSYLDWVEIRKNCFPGLLLPFMAVFGASSWVRSKRDGLGRSALWFVLAAFGVFLFLSFGANNPLLARFRDIPIVTFLRVPSRFYLVCQLLLAILFAVGVEASVRRLRSSFVSALAIIGFGGIFILENVPFPLIGYEYASLIQPSKEYVEFFDRGRANERKILLDLPSTIRFLPQQSINTADRIWFFTREALYMNWQTYHRQIIVGGANGYVSKARTEVEDLVRGIPESAALSGLKRLGVSHLVFHKNLILSPDEDLLEILKATPSLKMALETDREAIFEISD